jgi:hypothetical protein
MTESHRMQDYPPWTAAPSDRSKATRTTVWVMFCWIRHHDSELENANCHLSFLTSVDVAVSRSMRHLFGRHRKYGYSRWNRVAILFQTNGITAYGLPTAILDFGYVTYFRRPRLRCYWTGRPQKHTKWRRDHVYVTFMHEIRGSHILAYVLSTILDLITWRMSGGLGSTVIKLADPENIGNDTKISSVSWSHMKLRGWQLCQPLGCARYQC